VSDSGAWNAVLIIAGADIPAAEQKVLDLIAASPFGRMLRKARVLNPNGAPRRRAQLYMQLFKRTSVRPHAPRYKSWGPSL
jgi:hypothetical protein